MANQRNKHTQPITWAQASRDVLITAMNRGQLPLLAVCAIVFLLIFKLDSNNAFQLLKEFITELKNFYLAGWILWIITIILWVFYAKKVRKDFSAEMMRVGREKSKAQEKAGNRKLPSSNKR